MGDTAFPHVAFLMAAVVPRDAAHVSGDLSRAESLRAAHPEVAGHDIHAAAVLGDDEAVRRLLKLDAAVATAPGGPYGWDALTHLCFSRYLRLDPARSEGFVRAAAALLEAGASANSGFWDEDHQPQPEWESVLYGAAGVAHHPGVTRLLLEHGAEPNDEEVPYHAPEGWDNAALVEILRSGRLSADSLTMMLLRKSDWHDLDGMRLVLDHGADVNRTGRWGRTILDHALRSDNALAIFELLLDRGADPEIASDGVTAVARAARTGRRDVLELFEARRVTHAIDGVDGLLAACARDDAATVRAIAGAEPSMVRAVIAHGGRLLSTFSRVGNAAGVRHLLDLGVDANAEFAEGEGYWDIAPRSTALHAAAWRGRPDVMALLIARDADVNRRDGRGRTPLMLAVRACVDSYWMERRSPEWVRPLLAAGARLDGVTLPCGYDEVDDLLRRHGAGA